MKHEQWTVKVKRNDIYLKIYVSTIRYLWNISEHFILCGLHLHNFNAITSLLTWSAYNLDFRVDRSITKIWTDRQKKIILHVF